MSRLTTSLMVAALAGTLASGAVHAQMTTPPSGSAPHATSPAPATPAARATMDRKATTDAKAKAEPSAWDKTKAMTRKQWNEAKKKWAQEKGQWKDCNDQSKRDKLKGTKSWSFIANCMTKS